MKYFYDIMKHRFSISAHQTPLKNNSVIMDNLRIFILELNYHFFLKEQRAIGEMRVSRS
jgi:hypothetical protein